MSSRVPHLTGAKYHKSISKRQRRLQTTVEPSLKRSTPLATIDDLPQNMANDSAFGASTELESLSSNLPCSCLSCVHSLRTQPPAKHAFKWGEWSHRTITVPHLSENAEHTPLALAAHASSYSIFGPITSRPSTPMRSDGWVGTSPLVSAFLSAVHGPIPHDWQRDHIAHVANGGDILVATGTGTGKSAVADAAWASSLARLSNRGGVALISAPLLAIVEQTGTRARALAHMGGWNVREVGAGRGTAAAPPARVGDGADALVCTTHRLESIVWEALAADTLSRVCCVVVDEAHCISQDAHAGVALETALTLLLYTRWLAGSRGTNFMGTVGSGLPHAPAVLPTHAHTTPSTSTRTVLPSMYRLPQLVLLSASLPTSGPFSRAFTRWLGYPRTATAAPRPLALTQLAVCAGGSASGPAGGMVCTSDSDGTWVSCPEMRTAALCASAGVRGSVYSASATSNRAVPHTSAAPSLFELLHAGAVAVVIEACAAHAPAFLFAANRRDVGGYLTTVAKQLPRALCRALVEALEQLTPFSSADAAVSSNAGYAVTAVIACSGPATAHPTQLAHGAADLECANSAEADAGGVALVSAVARDIPQAHSSVCAPTAAWVWVPGFQSRHSTALDGVGRGFPLRVCACVDGRVDSQVHVGTRGGGLDDAGLSVGVATGVKGSALVDAAAHAASCLQRAMATTAASNGASAAGAAQVVGVRRNPSSDASSDVQVDGHGDASRMCVRVLVSEAAVALLRARARLLRQLCVAAPAISTAVTASSITPTASAASGAAASPPAVDDWCVEGVTGPTRNDTPQLERLSAVLAAAAVAAVPARHDTAGGGVPQPHQRAAVSVAVSGNRGARVGVAASTDPAASVLWLDVRHLALHMQAAIAVSVALVLPPCASLAPPAAPRNIYKQRQRPRPCVPQLCLSPLGAAVALGVGAHNAGMSRSQRDHMHHAFARQAFKHTITDGVRSLQLSTSVLCGLVCTTTVATGVDAPVATVAVLGAKVAGAPMTSSHYRQAIGRAGRRERAGVTVVLNSETTTASTHGQQGRGDDTGGSAGAALLRDYVDVVETAQRGRSILFCEHPCRARALSLPDALNGASLRSAMDTGAWASLLSRWVAVRGVCAFSELISLAEHTLWAVQAAEAEEAGGTCAACAVHKQVDGALSLLVSHMALFALPSPSTSPIPTRPHAHACSSPLPSPFAGLLFRPSPLAYASLHHSAPMLDVLVRAHHTHTLRRTLVLAPGAAELHAFATALAHHALLDPLLHMAAPALAALPPAMLRALGLDATLVTAATRVPEHAPRHALTTSPVAWLDALARVCVAHTAIMRYSTTTTNTHANMTTPAHGGAGGGASVLRTTDMRNLPLHAPTGMNASAPPDMADLSAATVAAAWASAAAHGARDYVSVQPPLTGTGTDVGAGGNIGTGITSSDAASAACGVVIGTTSEGATTPTSSGLASAPPSASLAATLTSLQSALAALHNVAMARASTAALCTAHAHGADTVTIARASGQSRAALANLWQAAGGALRVAAGEAMWSGDRITALVLSNMAAWVKWERERR